MPQSWLAEAMPGSGRGVRGRPEAVCALWEGVGHGCGSGVGAGGAAIVVARVDANQGLDEVWAAIDKAT
mgnify:CR=1 FL=1